jgi:hypothetical protein
MQLTGTDLSRLIPFGTMTGKPGHTDMMVPAKSPYKHILPDQTNALKTPKRELVNLYRIKKKSSFGAPVHSHPDCSQQRNSNI